MHFTKQRQAGFTIIELVLVVVVLFILGTLVALAYSGVQANKRDNQRQTDVDTLQSHLEVYYALNNAYPSAADISNPQWRATNMPSLSDDTVRDPRWVPNGSCSTDGKPTFGTTEGCYNYDVSAADGAVCDNLTVPCAHYTLSATLESNQTYVKASLN